MIEPIQLTAVRSMRFEAESSAGARIVASARNLAHTQGHRYARASYPVSPESSLTGNTVPGETPLRWLRGHNKCNQFVGDALFEAGFRMPLFRMSDGSSHFMHAAALPSQREFFAPVTRNAEIEAGDLLVIRHPGRGENSGHVEIITDVEHRTGTLRTLGAHPHGVEERRRVLGERASVSLAWSKGNDRWFVLRPHARFSIED